MADALRSYLKELHVQAKKAREGKGAEISSLASDVDDLCQQLSLGEELSLASSILFDSETGVLRAVDVCSTVKDGIIEKGRERCLVFVAKHVELLGKSAAPYAISIKNTCCSIFKKDPVNAVKAAALKPLFAIVRATLVEGDDLNVATMVKDLMQSLPKKTNPTVESAVVQLVALSAEKYPKSVDLETCDRIMSKCMDILLKEKQKEPPTAVLVAGVLRAIDSVLCRTDSKSYPGGSLEKSKLLKDSITAVLQNHEAKQFDMWKAGLGLLERHAARFVRQFLPNAVALFDNLLVACCHTNRELKDAALPALDQYLLQIAKILVEGKETTVNLQKLYTDLLVKVVNILNDAQSSFKLVSVAIRALGRLAAPIAKFSGTPELRRALHRLLPFGADAVRSGEGRAESLGYSVTLVGAFADMVVRLEDVEEYMVTFITRLVGNIFYQFPDLYAKQKLPVYMTICALLKALYLKGPVFGTFLSSTVLSSLVRASTPVDAPPGEVARQLWPDYLELWVHLITVSLADEASPGSAGAFSHDDVDEYDEGEEAGGRIVAADVASDVAVDLSALRALVYDSIMRNYLTVLRDLNLRYRAVEEGAKDSAPQDAVAQLASGSADEDDGGQGMETDAVEPDNPADMRKFLNLVEFGRSFLVKCGPQHFSPWLYPFSQAIADLACRYPLLSGLYKLLQSAIELGSSIGYFKSAQSAAPNSEALPPSLLTERQLCKELLSKFLREVLVSSRRFKMELLATCLRLCLSSPPELVAIPALIGPMRNALHLGLGYPIPSERFIFLSFSWFPFTLS